jgi:hypothetical protein
MGKGHELGLDDAAQAGPGQLDLAEADRGLAVVVDGDGRVPDLDAVVAEVLGPAMKLASRTRGQAYVLPGDAFHARRDVGDERRVDEPVEQEEYPREARHQPDAEGHVGQGREDVDAKGQPDGDVAAARRRGEEGRELSRSPVCRRKERATCQKPMRPMARPRPMPKLM